MPNTTINLITAPDKLLNNNYSLLLINPSNDIKENFNEVAKSFDRNINLYLYEGEPMLQWLVEVANIVDNIVIDIDNTIENKWLIGYILSLSKTFYLTKDTYQVYNTINNNVIYDLSQILEGVKFET